MKKALATALVLALLLSLAACGGASDEPKGITVTNQLGWDLTEIYIVTAGADSWGDPVIGALEDGISTYLYPESAFGSLEVTVDICAVDGDGDLYQAFGVSMADGDTCALQMTQEADFQVLVGETAYAGQWGAPEPEETEPPETTLPPLRPLSDLTGVWEFSLDEAYILFYEDMTWEVISFEADILDDGEYQFDGQQVMLPLDGRILSLQWDEDGFLVTQDESLLLRFVCSFEEEMYQQFLAYMASQYSYFEEMGYEVDYLLGEGGVYMADGALVTANTGEYYERMPVTYSLELASCEYSDDGYVEYELVKTVVLDGEDFPEFIKSVANFSYGVEGGLYDYYTGYHLMASAKRGNSAYGDYCYEYEAQGRPVCIDYSCDAAWSSGSGGTRILEELIYIRMPADYDGLLYGFPEAPESFLALAESMNGDVEDGDLEMISDIHGQSGIFCRINSFE